MDKKLKDQIAIITGASSGIGAGCAIALAAAGATVVINYPAAMSKEKSQKVLDQVSAEGGKGILYQADVSKEDEVVKMFADVITQFGTVDILINNAGLQKDAKLTEMTLEDWNYVLGVNLTGQFLCARQAVREFLRRGN
ncbi:MAG TPA: SDR family NAD(P)-dependent oxidoreductase, partial [Flavitalea sp.]|nr:SDR family NAD(P)-dependent oxidoreductase [Flavitalea sp.]